jgi:hypothetical protein
MIVDVDYLQHDRALCQQKTIQPLICDGCIDAFEHLHWLILLCLIIFFSLHNRGAIFVHNIYNLLAHVPVMDYQQDSTFEMWSTVGEYFLFVW